MVGCFVVWDLVGFDFGLGFVSFLVGWFWGFGLAFCWGFFAWLVLLWLSFLLLLFVYFLVFFPRVIIQ